MALKWRLSSRLPLSRYWGSKMSDQTQLEREVHALLDQANVSTLVSIHNRAATKQLIIRMRDCADRATNANLSKAAQRLRGAADVIEQWLQDQSGD
jgi:hypothetical protein